MNRKLTPIASAVAILMLGASISAQAQQAQPAAVTSDQPATEQVVVTGIRASKQKSLDVKRNADVIEEVVSAEDIGKMPDKNVADAVERLPGVQVQNGASGTGGSFDEPDRVSIRSTSPSLTSTTINGHTVSSGDWFVLDQTGLAGRSVSFDLMPAEIVSRVVVHKDQVASDQEGGTMGNVDIETYYGRGVAIVRRRSPPASRWRGRVDL
jgi:iron complex outermembrane receptor protein